MNENKQRIQCLKCRHFKDWHEGDVFGRCSLYDRITSLNNSCNLKEMRKEEKNERKRN